MVGNTRLGVSSPASPARMLVQPLSMTTTGNSWVRWYFCFRANWYSVLCKKETPGIPGERERKGGRERGREGVSEEDWTSVL